MGTEPVRPRVSIARKDIMPTTQPLNLCPEKRQRKGVRHSSALYSPKNPSCSVPAQKTWSNTALYVFAPQSHPPFPLPLGRRFHSGWVETGEKKGGEGEQTAQANYFKVRLCHSQNRRGEEERKLLKEKGRGERKAKRLHGGGGCGRGSALLCVCVLNGATVSCDFCEPRPNREEGEIQGKETSTVNGAGLPRRIGLRNQFSRVS